MPAERAPISIGIGSQSFRLPCGSRMPPRDNKLVTRLRFASLRQNAVVEDVDTKTPRGLDRALFQKLVAGEWVERRHNLLIIGPTGSARVGSLPGYSMR